MNAPETERSNRPLAGIMVRLAGAVAISIMFAFVKLAGEAGIHFIEAVFWRQLFVIPMILFLIRRDTAGWGALKSGHHNLHRLRALVGICAMSLNYWAVTLLPLADAQAIGFAVPIFASVLAALLLHEQVGWRRWLAILIGFAGVVIVIQPGGSTISTQGAIVALAGAVMTALVSLLIRVLGRTEKSLSTIFWFSLYTVPLLAVLLPFFGTAHDAYGWSLLLGVGMFGALVQFCVTESLRLAPVSTILPMDYTSLIWATLIGFLLFGHFPDLPLWIGAPVIVGSGLFIAWREQRRVRRAG